VRQWQTLPDEELFFREAIARFDPVTMTADEPEVAAKPFPRRWIWIIALCAAAIVAVECLGVVMKAGSTMERSDQMRSREFIRYGGPGQTGKTANFAFSQNRVQ